MKIECDKCSAKYSIADEKVRGKTFKIRCKKCSNVIIVRDKTAGAGLAGEAEAPAAIGWHLAINGETVGPMAEDDVRQRFRAGEIDRETAIWQEGFEDWIPLGEVDTFADLAAGDAAEDPFASANQEEYAAPAVQARAVSHSAAPVARAAGGGAVSESQGSPRVSRLTGQRNENSVLFSLDSLQALATGGNAANTQRGGGPQRTGPKGLATVAPSSEGSGLIDIRSLGAMVGADASPSPVHSAPRHDDASLPSFGGASLGGLASAPLVPQVSAADHMGPSMGAVMAPQQQRSNAPMYVMMVILLLAVLGLGAFIFLRPPQEPVIVERTVQGDAPSVRGDDKDDDDKSKSKDDDDDDDKDKDKNKDKDKDDDGADGAKEGEEAGEVAKDEAGEGDVKAEGDKPGASKPSGSKPSGSKPSGSKPSTTPSSSKPSTTPTPSKPSSGADLDVDCILDPKLAKCKGGGSSSKPSSGSNPKPAAPVDPSLPETLTTNDIKAGVAPVKDAAKSCGSKHGAAAGDKVKVKLSISGTTGAVTSAAAEPPFNGTPLGNCVAAALKKAQFKKFRKPTLGAVYPVTM
jgi:predicted Zn finger-like uncharacterized protein